MRCLIEMARRLAHGGDSLAATFSATAELAKGCDVPARSACCWACWQRAADQRVRRVWHWSPLRQLSRHWIAWPTTAALNGWLSDIPCCRLMWGSLRTRPTSGPLALTGDSKCTPEAKSQPADSRVSAASQEGGQVWVRIWMPLRAPSSLLSHVWSSRACSSLAGWQAF